MFDDTIDQGNTGIDGNEKVSFEWQTNNNVLNELNFTDYRFRPEAIKAVDDWVIYSDSEFNAEAGRVVVRSKFY